MTLDEWLWRNKCKYSTISKATGIHYMTISLIAREQRTPSLFNALAIYTYTKKEVELETMLDPIDQQILKEINP